MRILFIGNDQLQNQAIMKILTSEGDVGVEHMFPVNLEEQSIESNPHSYKVALVDLTSFQYSPDVCIKLIKENNLSRFVIAMHTYTAVSLISPIIKAGADRYLSLDSSAEELLKAISELNNS